METSRATNLSILVQQTERTIKRYIQDDCNVHLATVTVMEDISYKLWVESNSAFLEENLDKSLVEEDPWQWDEECFFNSPIRRSSNKKQRLHLSNRRRSTFSATKTPISSSRTPYDEQTPISSSRTPYDEQTKTKRSTGRRYKSRTASVKSNLDISRATSDGDEYDSADEWVVIDERDVLPNDRDWLVLSRKKNSPTESSLDDICTEYVYSNDDDISVTCDELELDNEATNEADDDDWVILSMEIVERSLSGDVSGNSTQTTPDSGIQSSGNSVRSSLYSSDDQLVNSECKTSRRKLHFS